MNVVIRSVRHMANLSEQCFHRNWMHNKLWVNDPDYLIMTDTVSPVMHPTGIIHKSPVKKFYRLNNIYIHEIGGMVLSSDYVNKYGKAEIERLKRILDTDYTAAKFDDILEIGTKDTEYFLSSTAANLLKK